MPIATASQTVGPYWHLMEDPSWADLTRFGAQGEKITLTGVVLDGDGKPCADACVEIWQSDPPASEYCRLGAIPGCVCHFADVEFHRGAGERSE